MEEIRPKRRATTEKQREAARQNGAKSRGPKTEAGKRRSSMNALCHALTSGLIVLSIEDRAQFEELRTSYVAEFQPATQLEFDLIEEMTAAKWRQKRAWSFQCAILDARIERMAEQVSSEFTALDQAIRGALAFAEEADESESLALMQRYESMHARHFRRAWKDLLQLRDRRKEKFQNEPEPAVPAGQTPGPDSPASCPGNPELRPGNPTPNRGSGIAAGALLRPAAPLVEPPRNNRLLDCRWKTCAEPVQRLYPQSIALSKTKVKYSQPRRLKPAPVSR